MQDQPHYNITPEQGWARMKPVLDQAMPAGKPSRRLGWWWMPFMLLVTAGIGFTWFNDSSVSTDGKTTATRVSPGELHTIPAANERTTIPTPSSTAAPFETAVQSSTSQHAAIEASAVSPSTNNSQKRSTTSNTPSSKTSNKTKTNRPTNSKPSRAKEPMASNTVPDKSPASFESVPTHKASEIGNSNASSGIVADNLSGVVVANRNIMMTQPIPSIEDIAFESSWNQDVTVGTTTADKLKTRPHLLEPYLFINALAGINRSSGWSSGAGVNVNLGHKLSLVTSIGYLNYNPNAPLIGGTKQLDANVAPSEILNYDPVYNNYNPYVIGEAVNRAAGYSTIAPLVDKVTQWQWSAGVKWKWTTRFYSDAGVTFGFGTSAYTQYPIFNVDPLSTPTGEITSGNSLSDYNVVRTSTTSAYVGLGYRLGKHLDLFTQWTHGFNHYLDVDLTNPTTDVLDGERTDYIRGLNLGLRFTL